MVGIMYSKHLCEVLFYVIYIFYYWVHLFLWSVLQCYISFFMYSYFWGKYVVLGTHDCPLVTAKPPISSNRMGQWAVYTSELMRGQRKFRSNTVPDHVEWDLSRRFYFGKVDPFIPNRLTKWFWLGWENSARSSTTEDTHSGKDGCNIFKFFFFFFFSS